MWYGLYNGEINYGNSSTILVMLKYYMNSTVINSNILHEVEQYTSKQTMRT